MARICATRTPSAPTPSEDTCVPASRATWATAPSVEVILPKPGTDHGDRNSRDHRLQPSFHAVVAADPLLCNITVSLGHSAFTSANQAADAEMMEIDSDCFFPPSLPPSTSPFILVSCWPCKCMLADWRKDFPHKE